MDQDWRPSNWAISCVLMNKLLTLVETKIRQSSDSKEREKWVTAGSYFCFCYVLSLRSPEGLMVDLPGLIQYGETCPEFVIIPLLGQVEGGRSYSSSSPPFCERDRLRNFREVVGAKTKSNQRYQPTNLRSRLYQFRDWYAIVHQRDERPVP